MQIDFHTLRQGFKLVLNSNEVHTIKKEDFSVSMEQQLGKQLGSGSFGTVFEAWWDSAKLIAVKVFPAPHTDFMRQMNAVLKF